MFKTYIIAEAGINHNGSLDMAKKLVDAAAAAGADAVKFQTFKTENMVTKYAKKAKYQESTTGVGSQFQMLKKLELSFQDHKTLHEYCKKQSIAFLSTPFDKESVDLLEKLNITLYKISSGDLTNLPLLDYIARLKKPMVVSTGMGSLGEVEKAINTIEQAGNFDITLLHCTSNYPTMFTDVNLNAMNTLKSAFKLPVGYSDHTLGIEVSIAAVAMGAVIIEKHFTLDNTLEGPDHKASLEPSALKQMVQSIRNIENSLGDGVKKCRENEKNTRDVARKSIVAGSVIKKGELITIDKVAFKRPGLGISPEFLNMIVGKAARCNIDLDEIITFEKIGR